MGLPILDRVPNHHPSGCFMPIQVSCQCGQRFVAKDQLAGKRVKCPKCGNPLTVPGLLGKTKGDSHSISELLDQAGLRAGVTRCPGCGTEMSKNAILCVMCGFDLRRGHRIKTRVGSGSEMDEEDLGDLPTHGNPVLDEAERKIVRTRLEQTRLTAGVPWWMVFLALLGLVGFAVGMVSMPQDQVMRNSGYVMMVAGSLMSFFFTLRLVIDAFKEAVLQGLLALFPPYTLYFAITRWDRCAGLFLFIVAGLTILVPAVAWHSSWGPCSRVGSRTVKARRSFL